MSGSPGLALRLRQPRFTGVGEYTSRLLASRCNPESSVGGAVAAWHLPTGLLVAGRRSYHEGIEAKIAFPRGGLASRTQLYSVQRRFISETRPDHSANSSRTALDGHRNGRARSQSILITGGTSGIGFAIAKQAIIEGASEVRIVTRDRKRGQAAVERLLQEHPNSADVDFVEAEAVAYGDGKLFHTDKSNPSHFTTIIHSAGITQTSLLASTRPEDIRAILSVNLESAALLSKAHLKRYMQTCVNVKNRRPDTDSGPAHNSWQVINIASLLAVKGGVGSSIYAASKAGLVALTRATALEGAEIAKRYTDQGVESPRAPAPPQFRANVVLPGYIDTPMTHNISPRSRHDLLAAIPAGRFGTPDEVADAVMFLLGNEYANNCVLNLDGGLSAV